MRLSSTLLVCAALLASCVATVPAVAPGAPTAELNDRLTSDDDDSNERVFVVEALDGNPVKNMLNSSGGSAMGRGVPNLRARLVEIKTYVVSIRGRHIHSAPIVAIARSVAGKSQEVVGQVKFTPVAGKRYRVTGELAPAMSSIWIEDFDTREPVTEKITVQAQ